MVAQKQTPQRLVWRVMWSAALRQWELRRPDEKLQLFPTKPEAIDAGRKAGRAHLKASGLAQLVVHTKDGRIQTEWTYGADPRRTRG